MYTVGFKMTTHALDRLFERGGKELRPFKKTDLYHERCSIADTILKQAKEVKSFTNNSRFMVNIYERYGYDRSYRVFVTGGLIFIGIVNDAATLILTVLNKEIHYVPQLRHA